MHLPKYVHITEVGPRDGLQNEAAFVPTETKIDFINQLSKTGLSTIEVTSFVSSDKIPQLSDGLEVYTRIKKNPSVIYSALVPNAIGMQKAIEAHVQKICIFTAASETFTEKNIHCSIAESIHRFEAVALLAKQHHIPIRGYVSCALGCPYEGKIAPEKVAHIAEQLLQLGCDEIALGDTIGIGTPEETKQLIKAVTQKIPIEKIVMHFHDTYGHAIANIHTSLQLGITSFDSSASGLGGCPYAKGATGNVATEDVLHLLDELGIITHINRDKLSAAGKFISNALNRQKTSPLWQPSEESLKKTQLYQFMQRVGIDNYADLYQWSIQSSGDFWENVWHFCHIRAHQTYQKSFIPGEKIYDAQWFTGAKLNFAENLLFRTDEKVALIAYDETGRRRQMTYQTLYEQVAAVAYALKKEGVGKNDRIVGYLPNLPETIIAMLATTSLGAIWSCCSPDFEVPSVIERFAQIQPKILFTTDSQYYQGKKHVLRDKVSQIAERISSIQKIILIPSDEYLPPDFKKDNSTSRHCEEQNFDAIQASNFNAGLPLDCFAPLAMTIEDDVTKKEQQKIIVYKSFIEPGLTQKVPLTFESLPFNHPLYILYSSGTTGQPKCIVHSAGGTLIQHLKELKFHTDITSQDVLFFYTTCGWMMWNWMVSGLATGCTLLLYDGSPTWPTITTLFDIIEREKVSVFGTSAAYIACLKKEHVDVTKTHNLKHLRCILSTGSPLSAESFEYIYEHIHPDVQLSSISGGTDIVSCFALGNPLLPVYRGQLQCRGLGLAVAVYNESGQPVFKEKGELVCTQPFPCMPIYFWNDPKNEKYHSTYFARFENIWTHGDYAEITAEGGLILYGRSDTTLKPGGIRIGTAEIYRQVETIEEIVESVAVSQDWEQDSRIILFVQLRPGILLDEVLKQKIRQIIRSNTSPRHVPAKIIAVADIPRTFNGKIAELAVHHTIHHLPVKNKEALLNPQSLELYKNLPELIQ